MKHIYRFKKYNKDYPKIFEKEKKLLERLLSNVKIEHIGSTSIKGLGGKPVIDIIILSDKNVKKIKQLLIKNNYIEKPSHDKDRLFFVKQTKKQRYHLHLTSKKSVFELAIMFREHMKNNKKDRDDYEKLKKQAIKICKGDRDIYREHKNPYIRKIVNKFLLNNLT